MKLIVGLGNPGSQYENNRHNIGFKVIDAYASKLGVSLNKEKFNGIFYKGDDFIIAKPMTYMNLSGDFVQAISSFFKIDIKDILVIYDDMDHEVGKAAMKPKGSSGGQNGIKDIIAKLGTDQVQRLKVGVGRPKPGIIAADHVLSNFSKEDVAKLDTVKNHLIKAIDDFIKKDFTSSANTFNTLMK